MAAFRIALLVFLSLGCSRPIEAELLEIHGFGPDRVRPGQRIVIDGAGFPPGRDARVEFQGQVHRPAQASRTLDLELRGHAVSESHVEVAMPEAVFREFGGRGTFRGTLRVSFHTGAFDQGRVVGSFHGAMLDLLPSTPLESGPHLGAIVGLDLDSPDGEEPGLPIADVAPGGLAASAGLASSDRILSVNGVRVFSEADIAVAEDAHSASIEVARNEEILSVSIPLEGMREHMERRTVRLAQLAALVWMATLIWFGPGVWLDRLAPRNDKKRTALPWLPFVFACLGAVLIRHGLTQVPLLGLESILCAITAGRIAVLVLAATEPKERIEMGLRGISSLLAWLAVLVTLTICVGTTQIAALERAQGPWPYEWIAFSHPSGPLALLLVAIAAASGPRTLSARVRVVDDVFLIGFATCAIIALAGGTAAHQAIRDAHPALAWLGTISFAGQTAFCVLLLRRVRDRGAVTSTLFLFVSALVVAFIATISTLGWLELDVSRSLERAIGEVWSVAVLLMAARLITIRPKEPARPLHALL